MTMLTKDEAELYDRQIRLWGVNAQSRLRQSKVLMLGFNGVASEVAKILVLAGIDTLTIVDDQPLQQEDITSNLFCRRDDSEFRTCEVSEKLKKLNPLVKVNIDNTSIHDKKPQDFENYDLVTLHSFMTLQQTIIINDICRKAKIKFYIVLDYGFFGFMFSDLGPKFEFTYEPPTVEDPKSVKAPTPTPASSVIEISEDADEDRPKKRARFEDKKSAEPTRVHHSLTYSTFEEMIQSREFQESKSSPVLFLSMAMMRFYSEQKRLPRNADDLSMLNKIMAYIKDTLNLNDNVFKRLNTEWSENISGSLSPVCAIVGGVAGQDMIRALSGSGIPICNTFSFDGLEMCGFTEKIGVESANRVKPIIHDVIDIDSD